MSLWARAAAPAWLPTAAPGRAAVPRQAVGRLSAVLAGERGSAPVAAWVPLARSWPALPWAAAAYVILFCFVFTYSRGAWLLFPAVAALLALALPRGHRLGAVLLMAALAAAFAPWAGPFAAAVKAKAAGAAWRAFLLGVPLAVAASAAVTGVMALPRRAKAVALGAAGLAVAALAVLARDRVLSSDLAERVKTISLGTLSARERIEWIATALRVIRDHPIIGAGGGAWDALYHEYQRYGYYSTQVHGHYAQVAAETGIVGALALLAMWAFLLARAWRLWRGGRAGGEDGSARPAADRCLLAGALAAALALGLHSAIDFNLSLAAVSVALWALAGLLEAAGRRAGARPQGEYRILPRAAAYGLTAFAAAGVTSLLLGYTHGQRAVRALNAGRADEARAQYERAAAYDPFTASFRVDLGQIYEAAARQSRDAALLARARQSLERGLELEPHNANFHALYGAFLLRSGELERGVAELERSVALHPYEIRRYETLTDALVTVGVQLAATGRRDEALPLFAGLPLALSLQPLHLLQDQALVRSYGLPAREAFRFRSLWATGLPVAFGSDAPVAPPEYAWNLEAATRHPLAPEEGLDPGEVLLAHTLGAARAAGWADCGPLAPGQRADLTLWEEGRPAGRVYRGKLELF